MRKGLREGGEERGEEGVGEGVRVRGEKVREWVGVGLW